MKVAVSGLGWMGSGAGSIITEWERLFADAEAEVILTIYSLSEFAPSFAPDLEGLLQRGVRVIAVFDRFRNQPSAAAATIRALARNYSTLQLWDFDHSERDIGQLHAKVIVVDRRVAFVGSANISYRGLNMNHELGVILDDKETVDAIASAVGRLLESGLVDIIELDD